RHQRFPGLVADLRRDHAGHLRVFPLVPLPASGQDAAGLDALEVSMLLSEMTWPQVKQLDVANMIVVLPTGSFEQHGPHLPFTVDTDLVTAVARGVERKLPDKVLLLPTLPVGMSTHHNAFPGTLDVPQPLYIQLIRE